MICMCIGVNLAGNSGNYIFLLCHARKPQMFGACGRRQSSLAIVMIGLGDDFQRLLEHFPKFNCFVCLSTLDPANG